jgi:uncharacterized cupredoxin-like copper-binding protein
MYNTDLPTRAELPSTGKLLRSTAIAALIAAGLLVTAVLPAEYGIDPTSLGRALGLTRMGEIKVSLAAEAAAGETAAARTAQAATSAGGAHDHEHDGGHEHAVAEAPAVESPSTPLAAETAAARENTVTVALKPGEAAEIKLSMRKDTRVRFEWSAAGGPVNYDTHGDPVNAPKGFYHGYGKGRDSAGEAGTLTAAFDGKHGWYWRNRSGANVTITLKTSGDYEQIERVL